MKHNKTYCPICSSVIDIYTTVDSSTWLFSKKSCSATAFCDCCDWNYYENKTFYGRTVRKAVDEFCSYIQSIRMNRRCGSCKYFILDEGSNLWGKCSFENGVPFGNLAQTKNGLAMNHYNPNNIYSWVNCCLFTRKDM